MLYGAEAFAESCGFKPHKDWAIGQLILEEDDDRIQITDIPFGEEGVPAYYPGPNDDDDTINRILATLDKNLGPGNYYFYEDDKAWLMQEWKGINLHHYQALFIWS